MSTALNNLAYKKSGCSRRESSWDRTGGNKDFVQIAPGEEKCIFDIEGPAQINHIWFTFYAMQEYFLRRILVRMYWDGEENPSVDVPIGDFFGVGHGVANHYTSLPLNMITKQGGPQPVASMNSYFCMPFVKRGKITIVNQCEKEIPCFYFYIDYRKVDGFTEKPLYFHACWHRENPTDGEIGMEELKKKHTDEKGAGDEVNSLKNTTGEGNYIILDAKGCGHYIGCNLSIDNINPTPNISWFGEGDDMIFIDGDKWPPTLHGTGTEDYFCAAWDYPSKKYDGLYQGVSLAEPFSSPTAWEKKSLFDMSSFSYSGKWTTYRFHIEDPVIFKESIKVTIEHGHANSMSNDYSSTAYWYQGEPHMAFKPMPDVSRRLPLSSKESIARYCRTI